MRLLKVFPFLFFMRFIYNDTVCEYRLREEGLVKIKSKNTDRTGLPVLANTHDYSDYDVYAGILRINKNGVITLGDYIIGDVIKDLKIICSTGQTLIFKDEINLKWYKDYLISRGHKVTTSDDLLYRAYMDI